MENNQLLELYLRKVIEFCEIYDAFSIPAAMMAGGAEIKLQDIYTHLPTVKREEYESGKSTFYDRSINKNRVQNVLDETEDSRPSMIDSSKMEITDIDALIAEIDRKIAELEKEESNTHDSNTDATSYGEKQDLDEIKKEKLNWVWFLSAPGGGKTTLLKMYSLAYAYKYYVEAFGKNEELFGDVQIIENICNQLGVIEGACPIFISARDLREEDYPHIFEADTFKTVIIDAIISLIGGSVSSTEVEQLLISSEKKIYIIDSVEEFSSSEFRKIFLEALDVFTSGSKCYLSSRYREYMDNVKDTKLMRDGVELSATEYVIEGLTSHFDSRKGIVREFAERWYEALNKISGKKKLDVEKDFLTPLYNNANVRDLIANPLELTSLLMISSYDSCLPSDFVKIYGRSIELWLSWNNYARYNYEDVMRQLSQVAYQMAISENEKIVVSHNTLVNYIKQSRLNLRRYYQQEWSENEESINDFIQFLCRSHIVSRSTEGYDFIHRQYQAYLVAYCITTNNFSRETRKKSRMDYVEDHIREKDDFWNQIIIIIVMLDIDLRDDIISTLFRLSERNGSLEVVDTNYYVSLLIQLAVMPGVNFDDYELEKLFNLIVNDESKWILFSSKRTDLQKLFSLNEEKDNALFIKAASKKNQDLSEVDQDKFRDKIATIVFYCIWYCKVDEQCVKIVLSTFFTNFINTNIIEMIFNSKKLTEQQQLVRDAVNALGKDAINNSGYSDCYMLIAAIAGYADDSSPYHCIDELIVKETFESDVIAINILVLATWLIRCNKASRYGYSIDSGIMGKYADFVLKGLVDDSHIKMRRDYLVTFSDIFSIGETVGHEVNWFRESVFDYILKIAISEYRSKEPLYDEDGNFSKCFEHISLYPCEYSLLFKKIITELNFDITEIKEKIRDIYDSTDNLISKARAAKLLIIFSDMHYDERMSLVKELEKKGGVGKSRQKLKHEDLEKAYLLIIEQIKNYVPEGKEILEDLDFSNFKIELGTDSYEKEIQEDDTLSELEGATHDVEEYIDYYSLGEYEKAKNQYLKNFNLLSCRNNLAYMLRRGEVKSVIYGGNSYSVEELLQEGIAANEPYSIINYTLYISWGKDHYDYDKGKKYLMCKKDTVHLLDAAGWWYNLKQKGELEGYLVLMWLCDLNLGIFETKEELEKKAKMLFPRLIEF
ncbi:MAG: hypothetical protein E6177_07660 [Clostridium sp.]|uniref:NACHT domain-containing protein n=1 Tax=Eisenbergiella porci TaxID=2652274 RepID=UPI00290A986D|nr:hypothetical protein [Clostridium sp.]